jgi:hypothetical protein
MSAQFSRWAARWSASPRSLETRGGLASAAAAAMSAEAAGVSAEVHGHDLHERREAPSPRRRRRRVGRRGVGIWLAAHAAVLLDRVRTVRQHRWPSAGLVLPAPKKMSDPVVKAFAWIDVPGRPLHRQCTRTSSSDRPNDCSIGARTRRQRRTARSGRWMRAEVVVGGPPRADPEALAQPSAGCAMPTPSVAAAATPSVRSAARRIRPRGRPMSASFERVVDRPRRARLHPDGRRTRPAGRGGPSAAAVCALAFGADSVVAHARPACPPRPDSGSIHHHAAWSDHRVTHGGYIAADARRHGVHVLTARMDAIALPRIGETVAALAAASSRSSPRDMPASWLRPRSAERRGRRSCASPAASWVARCTRRAAGARRPQW